MSWYYDEMRQVGVDFENAEQVAAYESKQGATREGERALVERLSLLPGQVVADMGCGTGSFAREAARAGARVRAVDVSRAMLEYLRVRASHEGLDGIEYEHAGFLTFEVPAGSIDVVVSRYALHHLPDFWKQVALVRIHRSLRAGGLLYLSDVAFSFDPGKYEERVENWVERMPRESGFAHLRAICEKQSVETEHLKPDGSRAPKKLDLLNGELAKAGAYTKLDQKSVTAWCDLRNNAAHGNYQAYSAEQVKLMIAGVRDFIGRVPA